MSKAKLRLLVLASVLLAVCVVTLGAFTRLKDAGLGCPDWPGCYGHIYMPQTASDINNADAAFPDRPFEAERAWPEVIHRYFAEALGFMIIVILVVAWRQRGGHGLPLKLPIFLLFLVIAQGMFGRWTVTLKLWPQVVTTHLLGGFATLSLLWLLYLRLGERRWIISFDTANRLQELRPWAVFALVVVVLQILLGGWTSSNYAALACPDFPACQNQWIPQGMDFVSAFNFSQHIGPDYLGGLLDSGARTAIHYSHRLGAIVTFVVVMSLAIAVIRAGEEAPLTALGYIIIGVLAVQVLLGISNVIFALPLPVAVAHNGVGAVLLLCMVTLNYQLYAALKR